MDEEKDFAIYYMKQRYHWLERMWNLRKSIIIILREIKIH